LTIKARENIYKQAGASPLNTAKLKIKNKLVIRHKETNEDDTE